MLLYFILYSIINFSTPNSISQNKSTFLIEGELKTLHFREGCLKTTRCSEPRFQLSLVSNNNLDAIRIDASIDRNMKVLSKLKLSNLYFGQFISSLALSSTIIGKDPIFKIPVECDVSSQIDILEESTVFATNYVEITGKCYSAVIEIKRKNNDDYYLNKKYNNLDNEIFLQTENKMLTNILNGVFIIILIITFMVISSYVTILLMKGGGDNVLRRSLRQSEEGNAFNDNKVPPYAIRQLKKSKKSVYGCRGKKTLSTIYESDDETPKRIPMTSNKECNNSRRFSLGEKVKKDDNDKVNQWMERGYIRSSCIMQPTLSQSSGKDSGMPDSVINKNTTPSDCGTSLFGGASGKEDEVYIDIKNLVV
uniref:ZP domain-containing protein n=1 Tax=Strongyloides stercoralis TaxID=6248 RepID=A0A0K0EEG4_STRER